MPCQYLLAPNFSVSSRPALPVGVGRKLLCSLCHVGQPPQPSACSQKHLFPIPLLSSPQSGQCQWAAVMPLPLDMSSPLFPPPHGVAMPFSACRTGGGGEQARLSLRGGEEWEPSPGIAVQRGRPRQAGPGMRGSCHIPGAAPFPRRAGCWRIAFSLDSTDQK